MKLNLGCGDDIRDGYVNVDIPDNGHPDADIYYDLDQFPYPWDDGSVEHILLSHVLEHLEDPEKVLRELHRILDSNGGSVTVKLPHPSSMAAYQPHTYHKHYFCITFFYRLLESGNGRPRVDQMNGLFDVVDLELHLFDGRKVFWPNKVIEPVLNTLFGNRDYVQVYERTFLCYLFPCREFVLKLEKVGD